MTRENFENWIKKHVQLGMIESGVASEMIPVEQVRELYEQLFDALAAVEAVDRMIDRMLKEVAEAWE